MPAEVELEGRRLCGWHHHTLGDPRLGHEAFGEWLTWLARSRTCSIWRHLPESELSDLMAGDEPFPGTEPGYCGEPGCPYEPNPSGVDGRIALETIKGFLEDFNSWERKERLREQPGILERAGVHPLRSATWIAIAREPNLAEKWGLKGRKR